MYCQGIAEQYVLLIDIHKRKFNKKSYFADSLTQFIALSQGNMSLGNM